MTPRYSPVRFLIAIALVLGVWATVPVAVFLAARGLFIALFTDALVASPAPAVVSVPLLEPRTATTLAA